MATTRPEPAAAPDGQELTVAESKAASAPTRGAAAAAAVSPLL